jgi:hypothetical protein
MFTLSLNRLIIILLVATFSMSSTAFSAQPPRHPAISKWLVGNNAWYNPGDLQWNVAAQCPLQSVRFGGEGYDGNLPGQTEDWIKRCNTMGAQPIIQIPAAWGGDQAGNWVKNHPDIIYYNIGNEPGLGGENVGVVAGLIKRCAPAMKAANPKIKIYVPDECDLWYGGGYYRELFSASATGGGNDVSGKTPDGKSWMIDGISWHRYAGGDITNDISQRIKECWEWADTVSKAKGRQGEDRIRCGIGEFNSNPGGPCQAINGQAFGCIFGNCMKYEYTYATTWSMSEGNNSCGGTDFSWMGGGSGQPRSAFYVMQMIAKNFSGVYCAGTSSNKDVFTYGCRDSNKLCAMIINKSGSSQSYTLHFDTNPITGGDCTINIDAETEKVVEFKDQIPAGGTQCIVIKCTGSQKTVYTGGNSSTTSNIDAVWCGKGYSAVRDQPNAVQTAHFSITHQTNGLTIQLPSSQQYRVELLSLNGAVLKTEIVNGRKAFCATDGLAKGMYVIRMNGPMGIFVDKVMVGQL